MTADEALAEMLQVKRDGGGHYDCCGEWHAALSSELAALRLRVGELEEEARNQSRMDRRCSCGNPSVQADSVDVCCDCGGYRP